MLPYFPIFKHLLPYSEYVPLISFLMGYFGFTCNVLQTVSWWCTNEGSLGLGPLAVGWATTNKIYLTGKGIELSIWFTVELLYKNRFDINSCL